MLHASIGRGENEKRERWLHSKRILTGQNGAHAKCSHGCREIAISIRQHPPHYRGVGDWHSHERKSRRKKSVAKMSAGAPAYTAMTAYFHGAMRLIMMRWGAYTCCLTSEFNRLGSDDGSLNLRRYSTVSDASMKCTITWGCIIDASNLSMIQTCDDFLSHFLR